MATVSFEYGCNVAGAFVTNPKETPVGWMTALDGFGLSAGSVKPDLTVTQPLTGGTISVVGVLQKLTWAGGAGDPLEFVFHVSQENATLIKALAQTTLENITVSKAGWWIADYDQKTKLWYEKAFPVSPSTVSGTLQGKDIPTLEVDLAGAPETDGTDVMLYKVALGIVPPANQQYALHFANSAATSMVKAWGLPVGTLATAEIPSATS